jgi:hypothetical protein
MLSWKPANSPGTILALQDALNREPGVIDYRDLHYYVTHEDIAAELDKKPNDLHANEANRYLASLGLDPKREVYGLAIHELGTITYGCFVPEKSLERINANKLDWTYHDLKPPRRRIVRREAEATPHRPDSIGR